MRGPLSKAALILSWEASTSTSAICISVTFLLYLHKTLLPSVCGCYHRKGKERYCRYLLGIANETTLGYGFLLPADSKAVSIACQHCRNSGCASALAGVLLWHSVHSNCLCHSSGSVVAAVCQSLDTAMCTARLSRQGWWMTLAWLHFSRAVGKRCMQHTVEVAVASKFHCTLSIKTDSYMPAVAGSTTS